MAFIRSLLRHYFLVFCINIFSYFFFIINIRLIKVLVIITKSTIIYNHDVNIDDPDSSKNKLTNILI